MTRTQLLLAAQPERDPGRQRQRTACDQNQPLTIHDRSLARLVASLLVPRKTKTPGAERFGWRHYANSSLPPIAQAALACFVEQGYHGTSIRTIAARAQLSVPGVYHHYASKQDLLIAIVTDAMADLWGRSTAALDEAGDDPAARLDRLVECLVLFHAHRRDQAFIAASEIRSLLPAARTALIGARDRQQRLLDTVISDGVTAGRFTTPVPVEVSRALVTMCTGVAQWYRSNGPLTADELAQVYTTIARMSVGSAV